ncbi:MAG: tetratricopeptide repeat protein, partial [Xanthomonadales bacterium]|nr:tetratricopeptide repeat protein [Xanthomonadales bacterium]
TQLRMADAQLQGSVALIHGELASAEQHTAVGAELARVRFPAGHWKRLDADVRQAEVALARRDLDRLRQWLTPAITDLQRRHWPDPLREAQARNLWLSLLRETGSTAEAEVYARHYVDWADRQFGARHSSTLTAHQGLNLVLLLADQLPEARQRLSADVQLASDWLGPSHATTLGLRLQLATLMARQGEPGSALVALESVRTDLLTQAEPDPEILLVTLGNLASRYKDMGQWAAAEASYAQVIEQATQIYGATHPRVWLNQANMAELLLQRGRSSAAMALASQVEAQAQDALGPTHRITAFATFLRGRALLQLGEAGTALPVLTQARQRLQAALGAEAGLSLRASWFLALAMKQAGQHDAARDLINEGLPISLRVHGASHPEHLDWQRLATELNAGP